MALAEARAAWQRTANRCLVQEDAKRAPKLACGSSASLSVKQVDAGSDGIAGAQDIPSIGCLPLKRNSSCSNLSPSSRWWLQNQPNYGHQKGLMNEQFNSLESTMETSDTCDSLGIHAHNEDDVGRINKTTYVESAPDYQCRIFATCQKDLSVSRQELRPLYAENSQDHLKLEDTQDHCELTNDGPVHCEVSKKSNEFFFDSESSWIRAEENAPWWRTADAEELALLVAQRSLELIDNCDLPQPQNSRVKKDLCANLCCFCPDGSDTSSLDPKPGSGSCHNITTRIPGSLAPEIACHKHRVTDEGEFLSSANKPLSSTNKGMPEMHNPENDPSKVQLLEALCHSQTRAREAVEAAKLASTEKERIVQLVFRQASQLFAYKQWFQLLQLENMCFQIRNRSQPTSTVFPPTLPWAPQCGKMQKCWQKSGREKRAKQPRARYDIIKYTVIFALGLGMVGAGLFLGWTVGCMLPTL